MDTLNCKYDSNVQFAAQARLQDVVDYLGQSRDLDPPGGWAAWLHEQTMKGTEFHTSMLPRCLGECFEACKRAPVNFTRDFTRSPWSRCGGAATFTKRCGREKSILDRAASVLDRAAP